MIFGSASFRVVDLISKLINVCSGLFRSLNILPDCTLELLTNLSERVRFSSFKLYSRIFLLAMRNFLSLPRTMEHSQLYHFTPSRSCSPYEMLAKHQESLHLLVFLLLLFWALLRKPSSLPN